jgi:ferric-dicitrate binding protein FerR (iron transport regulator)
MKEGTSAVFYHLITDKGFRTWVQSPNEQSDYFWKKWMEEHPENLSDLKKAREFIERLQFREFALGPGELDAMLGKVIAGAVRVVPGEAKEAGKRAKRFRPWQLAAAVLIIGSASMSVFFYRSHRNDERKPIAAKMEWVTVATAKGERKSMSLPDGTSVELNCESSIRFPRAFQGNTRQVELSGEAFFDVVHNDTLPFIVATNGIETEVLGTSFDVKSYPEEEATDVSLVKGKVRVRETATASVKGDTYLTPGQQAHYLRQSGEIRTTSFESENITAWKDGIIVLKDASLNEFIRQLERWYGVDFQVYGTPGKEWKVNGRYRDEKLDNILVGLKFIYGLDYKIQGKHVILKLE